MLFRLAGITLFALVGVAIGLLAYRILGHRRITPWQSVLAGIAGSFAGLWLADIADIRLFGNLFNSLFFAACGALIVVPLTALFTARSDSH